MPLIDTQTGAIEVGHTVRRRSSHIDINFKVVNRFGFGLIANRLVPVSEKKLIGSYY